MRRTRPLPDTHPELSILDHPTSREFRVENWRLARDGSKKVLKFHGWSWLDAFLPVVLAVLWPSIVASTRNALVMAVMLALYTYSKCTQVLWESVIAIPSLGIQMETHRGPLLTMPIFVSRHFIPLEHLQDFIINEGLRGWDVRYYIAAVKFTPSGGGGTSLRVAYENILPYFPVLLEVYHGVHEAMFNDTNENPG
ncbi:hypothetical protein BXZ70DRAFT_246052 [Cristinia sonorae]|uniref:Phosphatidylinositol N-acetylglucosaminyltransferase subunit H conserved domain-containing protein n=1 Tax=Cristinia sonorae TaxID=1940300 RepID=A0A8K0UWJ6_9AGAR|nr:hypothetical protein BXZ70DRAFT_246052 [Cristinia sonorae]